MLPIVRWHLIGLAVVVFFVAVAIATTWPIKVEVSETISAPDGRVMIPTRALVRTDSGWTTFLFTHHLAYQMTVEVRQASDSVAEIVSGLGPGAPVILSPPAELRHKTPVSAKSAP
jgi:multidrug efflux pump subunit AcrA (membrane-fusion protein)